jgi:hypothetical protein
MPIAGQSYIVELKRPHLMWGNYHPSRHGIPGVGRMEVYGEGYIPIPRKYSETFQILNSNNHYGISALYDCISFDRYYCGCLKAQGCSKAGDIYAKQFSEAGNLKAIGDWYDYVGAVIRGYIKVLFTSPNSMTIEYSTIRTGFHI